MKKHILILFLIISIIAFGFLCCSNFLGSNDEDPIEEPVYSYFIYIPNRGDSNISAYTINSSTGVLTEIAGSPFPAGFPVGSDIMWSIAVDPTGRFAYVPNESNNNVSAYTINGSSGELTEIIGSPFSVGGEPYGVAVDPTGSFVYVSSQSNSVSAHTINDTTGALTPIAGSPFPAGTGPRFLAVDPTGRFVYVPNTGIEKISAYTINSSTGELTQIAGSPFDAGDYQFSIAVTNNFAYVPNNVGSNVYAYNINNNTGVLTEIPGSPFPADSNLIYSIAVDPTGSFVFIPNTGIGYGNVSAYTINSGTGALTPIAGSPFPAGTGPHRLAVDPTGSFLYVVNASSNDVSAYTINSSTGALTPIAGSPFSTGNSPWFVAIAKVEQ